MFLTQYHFDWLLICKMSVGSRIASKLLSLAMWRPNDNGGGRCGLLPLRCSSTNGDLICRIRKYNRPKFVLPPPVRLNEEGSG